MRAKWHQRPTIHTLKVRAYAEASELYKKWDRRDNDETRLPATEAVHLGGLVLTEAFTPSTVSGLSRAMKDWPTDRDRRENLLADLTRSRRGTGGGWQNFGITRRPSSPIGSDFYYDPGLPDGVEAVWLHFNYTIPSLTMVVATFTLTEEAGDLSTLLRQDYQMKARNARVRIFGRGARLRARIPWARPASHGLFYDISTAADEKRRACAESIRVHQKGCEEWLFGRFSGRFAVADPKDRPVIRLMFTAEQVPFQIRRNGCGQLPWSKVSISGARPTPRFPGWALSLGHWPYHDGRHTITLAARRRNAAEGPSKGESGESNWYLTQRFGAFQAPLVAKYAMTALLSLYGDHLGDLRDRAGVKRRIRRPVRQSHKLDQYLIGDGLDAATITSDICLLTDDLVRFCADVPKYKRDMSAYPPAHREGQESDEFAHLLCKWLGNQARRLAEDTVATIGNIRASAELQQAIANTRLQRIILVVSVLAAVVAFVSLVVAIG